MNLTAGTVLLKGNYVLDTQLGNGVFELTYRATNTQSGQTVVIKTLGENLRQHSEIDRFKQKFLEMAERLSRCKHQNLVQVLDYFEEAGCPYLVMEYIPGQTLAALVESKVLPEAKSLEYIRQTANALSVLHKAGLLHRDVKPQNIIRRQDTDCVVLCEFGITCEFTAGVMQTHTNLLSAGYAPQEQYSLEAQRTRATDIYALAATLYDLLLGRPPLPAPVRQALQTKNADRLFLTELQQHTHKLSPTVKQALWQALAIAPQKRPQTVEAWLALFPKPEKPPLPQPKPAQVPVAKPKVDTAGVAPVNNFVKAKAKPTPKNSVVKPKLETGVAPLNNSATAKVQPTPKNSVVKPKLEPEVAPLNNSATAKVQPTPKNGKTPPLTPTKNSIPQPTLPQLPITKIKTSGGHNYLVPKKRKPTKAGLPLKALIMTSAIATSAGVGFGFALRINSPNIPGSSILHTEQSFPPSSNWPMSKHQL
ncbi:protein kinase [Microcoleus sp. FACHB-SPT15]|uniref:serine/threonine protein kinase n=1 Tax=Microcoleus sp. FACHB-SPT15 TaxID=2692830 RepID=UPI0017867F37|nr:serine/threonine-protein kinase [Microcoleus sp. FACHB-SPT15]MBD1805833.1 protein kinase [Microcoleus sp. FACHB-SPT15]